MYARVARFDGVDAAVLDQQVADIRQQLEENAGSQFDPQVVDAFLKLAPQALEAHPL